MPIIQSREYEGVKGTHRGTTFTIDGPQELLDAVMVKGTIWDRSPREITWCGGTSREIYTKAVNGSDDYLSAVNAILAKIDETINVQTAHYVFGDAVVGITPNVPNAIMGLPESMVMLESTQTDFAPITVWVDTSMSAGARFADIVARGAAITALVTKLQMIRPVNLKLINGLQGPNGTNQFIVCNVTLRPLNLSQISFMICSAGFARHEYSIMADWGKADPNKWDPIFQAHRHAATPAYSKDVLGFMGADLEHDIHIPGLHLTDPLIADPVGFITRTLERYRREDGAE